jgi:hypothetical protein
MSVLPQLQGNVILAMALTCDSVTLVIATARTKKAA